MSTSFRRGKNQCVSVLCWGERSTKVISSTDSHHYLPPPFSPPLLPSFLPSLPPSFLPSFLNSQPTTALCTFSLSFPHLYTPDLHRLILHLCTPRPRNTILFLLGVLLFISSLSLLFYICVGFSWFLQFFSSSPSIFFILFLFVYMMFMPYPSA